MDRASNINFSVKVESVTEEKRRVWVGGYGTEAQFRDETVGWFVLLSGSHEKLFISTDKPDVQAGDIARVRIKFDGRQ